MIAHLSSIHEALGLLPGTTKHLFYTTEAVFVKAGSIPLGLLSDQAIEESGINQQKHEKEARDDSPVHACFLLEEFLMQGDRINKGNPEGNQ